MEGLGRQLPGCDHGVKSWKTSMSLRILTGRCRGQGVYSTEGLGGHPWVWPRSKFLKTLHVMADLGGGQVQGRVLLCFINPRVRRIRNEASSCPGFVCCFALLTRGWGRLETKPPVALGSSSELFAFTMSLVPPVHPSSIFLTDTENL